MTHPRTILRREYAARLKGRTPAEDRVSTSRSSKVWSEEAQKDVLSVYTLNESAETVADSNPRTYKRTVQVAIEVFSSERTSEGTIVDDQVDVICQAVEEVMDAHLTLPDCEEVSINPSLSRYVRTEFDVDEEGVALLGAARVTYEVVYYTEAAPTSDPAQEGQFRSMGTEWDLEASADSTKEARDDIVIQAP